MKNGHAIPSTVDDVKTVEQITNSLDICSVNGDCSKCAYNRSQSCVDQLMKDARDCILRLHHGT